MVSPRSPRSQTRKLKAPVFPGYNVVRQLASGGMGVVYEAYCRATGQRVAIKTMLNPSKRRDLERRFLGEVVASQRIKHPSVVKVFDFGHDRSGYPFLVMEYLEGECLADRVEAKDLTVDEFCDIAHQLVEVVAAAHRVGVLHRDIKPANVILTRDPHRPGRIRIKLIDFGVAKFVNADGFDCAKTAHGVLIGTPNYMSPEQCLGGDIDARSDIYAMGCLLYELLTNRCPFVGSVADVIVAHRSRKPVPVASYNPAVPARLARLVDAMLSKRPSERPQTMGQVAQVLALLERDRRGPAPVDSYASIPRRVSKPHKVRKRANLPLASALTALALLVGAAAAMLTI